MALHDKILLTVISPESTIFSGEVELITLPGTYGEFTVYPHHAPLISTLEQGDIKFDTGDDKVEHITIDAGFVEVRSGKIIACVTLPKKEATNITQ